AGAEDRGDRGGIDAEQRARRESARRATLRSEPESPEERAAVVGALAVDQVRLGVAGLVVDRCEEEGGVGVRHLLEGGRLVALRQVLDARDDSLQRIGI